MADSSNPFLPLRADSLKNEQVIDFFFNHGKCVPLTSRGNQFVFGASGTGKTIALRYLSWENHLSRYDDPRSQTPEFLGIYVPLGRDTETWRAKTPSRDLEVLYENFILADITLNLCKLLTTIRAGGLWELDPAGLCKAIARANSIGDIDDDLTVLHQALSQRRVRISEYVNGTHAPTIGALDQKVDAGTLARLPDCLDAVLAASPRLQDNQSAFYLLLDQYDELSPWQQRVLNSLVTRFRNYFVKIASRPFGIYERTSPAGRNIWDAIDATLDLQFYRDELATFSDVVIGVLHRRLFPGSECDVATMRSRVERLLASDAPATVARYMLPSQTPLFPDNRPDLSRGVATAMRDISAMASDLETQRKLRSSYYSGIDRIVELCDGNIAVCLSVLSDAWEHARLNGEVSEDIESCRISALRQVSAVNAYSHLRVAGIESLVPDDGIHLMKLVDDTCCWWERCLLEQQRDDTREHDLEIPPSVAACDEVAGKLVSGFRYGILLPASSGDLARIPSRLNVSRVFLPRYGLVPSLGATKVLTQDDLATWSRLRPEEVVDEGLRFGKRKRAKTVAEHCGFLSISFREEEPAHSVRTIIQRVFAASEGVTCFEYEKFKAKTGSRFLLNHITDEIKRRATFCLTELSNPTPNVMLEFGLIKGLGKLFWALVHTDKIAALPEWVSGLQLKGYTLATLERVLNADIIRDLQALDQVLTFCPARPGEYCRNKAVKDKACVYLSYPKNEVGKPVDDTWTRVLQELRGAFGTGSKQLRLIVGDADLVQPTSPIWCQWCAASRSAGTVIVDSTPTPQEAARGLSNSWLQCFILGIAFGLSRKQKQSTRCIHLFHADRGRRITMWKGYEEIPWRTADDVIKCVLEVTKKRQEVSRGDM